MRTDVKFGLVLFFLIVLTGGGYFLFADRGEKPVDLATGPGARTDTATPTGPATSATRPAPTRTTERNGTAANPAARQPRPADQPRTGSPADTRTADASRPRGLDGPVQLPPGPRSVTTGDDAASRPATRPATETVPARPTSEPAVRPTGEASAPAAGVAPGEGAVATREPAVATPATGETQPPVTSPAAGATPPAPATANTGAATRSPATPGVETHRVTGSETFASLAKTYYGRPQLAEFLMHSNPQITDTTRLPRGTAVMIPPLPDDRQVAEAARKARELKATAARPANTAAAPATTSAPAGGTAKAAETAASNRRTYTVKSGDTFYDIARDQLGASSRWKELLEMNRSVVKGDPKNLRPGHVLILPDREAAKAGT